MAEGLLRPELFCRCSTFGTNIIHSQHRDIPAKEPFVHAGRIPQIESGTQSDH